MQQVFESINKVFSFVGPLSDFLWDFPTNFEWYRNIPLLGNFSFAIILLLGSGMYFSFRAQHAWQSLTERPPKEKFRFLHFVFGS